MSDHQLEGAALPANGTAVAAEPNVAEESTPVPESDAVVQQLNEADILAGLKEQDSNLIDIINSMEADRKKFLAHVRTKISCKETEFEVICVGGCDNAVQENALSMPFVVPYIDISIIAS